MYSPNKTSVTRVNSKVINDLLPVKFCRDVPSIILINDLNYRRVGMVIELANDVELRRNKGWKPL